MNLLDARLESAIPYRAGFDRRLQWAIPYSAGFDRCAGQVEIRCGQAGEDAAGGVAEVGAVEAEANAADQLLHVLLAETGVGATGARRRTVETLGPQLQGLHEHEMVATFALLEDLDL